jgi:hypothetical protein
LVLFGNFDFQLQYGTVQYGTLVQLIFNELNSMCFLCCLKLPPATGAIAVAVAVAVAVAATPRGGGGVSVVVERAMGRRGASQRKVLPLLAIHAAICKAHLQ